MYDNEMHRNGDRLSVQAIRYPTTLDSVHGAFTTQGLLYPIFAYQGYRTQAMYHKVTVAARLETHGLSGTEVHPGTHSHGLTIPPKYGVRGHTEDYINMGPYTRISLTSSSFTYK